ncbi:4374_t:CDS:2, partial [Rhizophagus irregularis]
ETQNSSTTTSSTSKLRQIDGNPDNSSSSADSGPIPLSSTCSVTSSTSYNCSTSPKFIAPNLTSDNKNTSQILAENPGMNNKVASIITAQMWSKEPELNSRRYLSRSSSQILTPINGRKWRKFKY